MPRGSKVVTPIIIGALVALFLVVITSLSGEECGPYAGVPTGDYVFPVEGGDMSMINSPYAPEGRKDLNGTPHLGVDIARPLGTPILAFADGIVVASGTASGFGHWIVVDHNIDGEKVSTVYGHMYADGLLVSVGDSVTAGQHIANMGSDGFATGSHLHFEVWPGGRLSGGTHTDPVPWLEKAGQSAGVSTHTEDEDLPEVAGDEQAPQGTQILNEDKLQPDARLAAHAVAEYFPEVKTIGGWRPFDAISDDHPSGRAIDIMIPDFQSAKGKDLGDRIEAFVHKNAKALGVQYTIWRQTYKEPGGHSNLMEDRHGLTANHFDHVHVTVFGNAATGEGISGVMGGADCDSGDGDFKGEVPEELQHILGRVGMKCPEVTSDVVAALMKQESQFNGNAVSPTGARGWAQFMPGTWAGIGAKVDDDTGEVIGPPGSGDPSDPEDAVMAAERYLCSIAVNQRPRIASGALHGDPLDLMLAGYNAGEGAVQQYGGIPPYQETVGYVKSIRGFLGLGGDKENKE